MTPTSTGANWALCLVVALSFGVGCKKRPGSGDPLSMNIPAPRTARLALTTEEKALKYPDEEDLDRDPFLFIWEEKPDEEPPRPGVTRRKRHVDVARPTVLKLLHDTVKGIIVGPRNTFVFQGKLYEEGDVLPETDWVVASITPTGIDLRNHNGQKDRLAFVREGGVEFQFRKGR